MSSDPVSVDIPDPMRSFIDERVRLGAYADAAEYLRDLVRRDREALAAERLSELIREGLASGPALPMTEDDWAALRTRAIPSGT